MHDIDRTQAEYFDEMEMEGFAQDMEADEFETYGAGSNEFETDEFETDEFETDEMELTDSEVLDEADEMELASELLEVQDEAELDQFIGKWFRKASPFVGKFLRSSAGRALGGKLKSFLRSNLGNLTGLAAQGLNAVVPGAGILAAPLAQRAGNALGNALGLEFEGLSNEDQEFEMARAVIRRGGQAMKQAANLSAGTSMRAPIQGGSIQGGKVRWVRMIRRGNRITLIL
jgi:hypothetical protein